MKINTLVADYFQVEMAEKGRPGGASIGVGAFLLALGVLYVVLTFLKITPNRAWFLPWFNNYIIGGVGLVIGLLILGYGVYARKLFHSYAKEVETLTEASAEQAEKLRKKEIALRESEKEITKKETSLRLAKAKAKASRELVQRKTKQMYKVRGKLGERSKRLKQIARIARVKKT